MSRRTARPRGLTLLELLVTLVIASMVLTVLVQILDQGRQVEQRLERMGEPLAVQEWRLSLLRETVRGLLPLHASGPRAFRGDATSFSGDSVHVPSGDGWAARWVRVELKRSADGRGAELLLAVADGSEPPMRLSLLRWTEPVAVRMRYLTEAGELRDDWEPGATNDMVLPRAILIEAGADRPALVLPIPAAPLPLISLRQLEQL